MNPRTLRIAMVNDVFFDAGGIGRLVQTLRDAAGRGAALALLPELPLNPWSPAGPDPIEADAEAPGGPRHQAQARAAREAGIGLVGGAIVRDPATGRRHNTALAFDAQGLLVAAYRKLHVPDEDGFREARHYEGGDEPPQVIGEFGLPLGIQVCSDSHRPEGAFLLAAQGAGAILVPRATEPGTFDRWRLVLATIARLTACYVLSVSRPEPGLRVPLGGPAVAVAPDGSVLVETTERVVLVNLEPASVERARAGYPGYLPMRADVYARGWAAVVRSRGTS
jgi:predicted amidohydrolase